MGRKTAVIAAAGAVAAVLTTGLTPAAAVAAVAPTATTPVTCSTPALVSAMSSAASGATLSLAANCTYVLTAALPAVARNLTIDGNRATLRRSSAPGTAAFTILTVNAGTVTVNQLNFTNGRGAIVVNGYAVLSVTGGVFRRNTAVNGAGISNTATSVAQVTGALFIDNRATGLGGAVYVHTALGDEFINCRFRRNTAAVGGGAIYDWSGGGTWIASSVFRKNRARVGGALLIDDEAPLITATVIQGNSATGDGGGISDGPGGNAANISGSMIIGNRAGGSGGGLDEENASFAVITNTIIERNYSAANGGGVNDGDYTFAAYTGDTISGNNARGHGGGVYNPQYVKASNTQITGNRAVAGGGGIFDAGPDAAATLTKSSPVGNKPDNCEPLGSIDGCAG